MILLMVSQALLAILYFYTAPFAMSLPLVVTLFINVGALFKMGQTFWRVPDHFFSKIKLLRIIFTATLLLLEFFIFLTPDPVSLSPLQGFINDAEVFVTGILTGILWQDYILKLRFQWPRNETGQA